MICKLILLMVMPLAYAAVSQLPEDPSASTVCAPNAGCMRGRLMSGYNIPYFQAFLGIPYALPPVGDLRFRSPKVYPKWEGTLNAFEAKSDCIQKNYLLPTYPVSGSEDCLYLNVYRPLPRDASKKLPVMIYIYGGGWFSGTANPAITGPEYIMDTEEVILVTFSYRLGAFGFLSTGDEVMPGNFGMKDQLLAMKWVNKNIESFGGDPGKVTLFGQSAGAISAHMHMLSRQSEGLFHGVISLSGTSNVPFAVNDDPLQQAIHVAELCGIKDAEGLSSQGLLQALQAIDANILLQAGDGLKFWSVDNLVNYRPVVEPSTVEDAFFTLHPEEILKSGHYQAVPFMLGFVPEEGAVRALAILESPQLRGSFNNDFSDILKFFLEFPPHMDEQQINEKMSKIIQEYFQGELEINNNTRLGLLKLITERGFYHPFYNAIKYYLNTIDTEKYPIFLYSFNYKGPYSYSTLYTGGISQHDYGVVHCDDLIYLFRSPLLFPDFAKGSRNARASQLYVGNFVHFAKTQQPLPLPRVEKCTNSTFQSNSDAICDYQLFQNDGAILDFDNKFNVRRMKFWDEILTDN